MFLQAEDYEEPENTLKPVGRRPPQPIPNPEPISQDVRTFNVSKLCQLSLFQLYRKSSKIWDTSNNCHNRPKNRKV